MTEFQIVTAIMNMVTSHEGVTNVSLSPEQVAEEIDTLRARMVAEMDGQGLFRKPYLGFTQTIPSIEVKKTLDRRVSYIDVPRMMFRRDNTPAYVYIGGRDDKSPYRLITGDQVLNSKHDQFIGKLAAAHYEEGHITFHNVTPNFVKIIAVFEDPSALEILGVHDTEVDLYPMPAGMIDQMIGKTAESYIRTLYRTPIQSNKQADIPQQNAGR